MTNKWIKLTRPDDAPIWFSVDQIVCIEPATSEEFPNAMTAITTAATGRRYVKEAVDTVEQML